jgi:hypothetical protein
MSSGNLYFVDLVRKRFGEHIASIFKVAQGDSTPQLCYLGITADYSPIDGYYVRSKNTVFLDVLMAIKMIYFFWDFVPRGSCYNRHFGEHIASNFSVP